MRAPRASDLLARFNGFVQLAKGVTASKKSDRYLPSLKLRMGKAIPVFVRANLKLKPLGRSGSRVAAPEAAFAARSGI